MTRLCIGTLVLLLLACAVFNVAPPSFAWASRVELKENGYTGIVVALSARLQGNVAGRQLIPPLEVSTGFQFLCRACGGCVRLPAA
ncbi:hypothetical protein HPB50_007500 [Hyalomma asiaticum]|uniref:Uncharacterized protein n=1 Tax=Hyalomma asiaticum TaxID=266040 RepID=A0ACB7S4M9_HYAAI|nr:hypothetical protein HPB50_007500 [Hyalomma asiaticum]